MSEQPTKLCVVLDNRSYQKVIKLWAEYYGMKPTFYKNAPRYLANPNFLATHPYLLLHDVSRAEIESVLRCEFHNFLLAILTNSGAAVQLSGLEKLLSLPNIYVIDKLSRNDDDDPIRGIFEWFTENRRNLR